MKKIIVFLTLALTFAACEDDVKFNDPAFQALSNYDFWRADASVAEVKDGTLRVYGTNGAESLLLRIPNYGFGKRYDLGIDDKNVAVFRRVIEKDTIRFKTGINLGGGYVIFDEASKQVPGTVSGRFVVDAPNTNIANDTMKSVYLHEGVFFRIKMSEITNGMPSEIPVLE